MSILQINTPRVFLPLLVPSRNKGSHGGRGSGKSHFFAELLIETCITKPTRAVGIREIQKSIDQSVKLLLEDKIKAMNVGHSFNIRDTWIETPWDGIISFQGMQNHTSESIKSLEGYDIAWFEEAQTASERSLDLLRPTIRKPDSELWFSWNPNTPRDPVDELLRGKNKVSNAVVVEANYKDNPYFPDVLRLEMEEDKRRNYDKYLHVWEGKYRQVLEGAVYADELRAAIKEGRIGRVPYLVGKPVTTIWDIGFADFTSIWFVQCIGHEFRIIDFYQGQFKKTAHYLKVMQDRSYVYDQIILPHDAAEVRINTERTTEQQVVAAFPNAMVDVLPNLGAGYKATGIEAVRNIFPQCWFDEEKCAEGLQNLKEYRYERDEATGDWSRTPLHDNNSHAADAFRYFAVAIVEPTSFKKPKTNRRNRTWESA